MVSSRSPQQAPLKNTFGPTSSCHVCSMLSGKQHRLHPPAAAAAVGTVSNWLSCTAVVCPNAQQLSAQKHLPMLLQAFFVMVIFIHNHNSMAYVHSTIVYSLEAPAGWLQSTSRTTVRAVTIKNAAGGAVTRAALTATTTTTTVAAGSAAASSSSSQGRWKRSIISRWPRPQHSKPQQLAAATGNDPLPGEGQPARDIELHPQRVAQVVRKAKAAQVQQVTEEGVDTQSTTAAEHYAVSHFWLLLHQ